MPQAGRTAGKQASLAVSIVLYIYFRSLEEDIESRINLEPSQSRGRGRPGGVGLGAVTWQGPLVIGS